MIQGIRRALICSFIVLMAFTGSAQAEALKGKIKIDGSSTVFPITEAVAEEFGKQRDFRRVRVTVAVSGTGGGFKKFCIGNTDINDASRRIKSKEMEKARKNKIRYVELPVAYDGLSVVINKQNDWVDHLTVAELRKIWEPGSKVETWKDIRSSWPDKKIKLYGPGTDSGTFDYFTEAINGKSQASRADFTKSEDDNVLVKGVAGGKYALGYFGYAYYVENKDKVRAVPIKVGNGKAVLPTMETINTGTYAPLSRPIFIYVNTKSLKRPEVKEFIRFYIQNAPELVKEVGYIPLPDSMYKDSLDLVESQSLKVARR